MVAWDHLDLPGTPAWSSAQRNGPDPTPKAVHPGDLLPESVDSRNGCDHRQRRPAVHPHRPARRCIGFAVSNRCLHADVGRAVDRLCSTADRIGRPRTFQLGLASFTVGSLLCSLAPNLLLHIVARIVQAVGGSMLNPVAMSIITNVFTAPAERARAIGVWGGVARLLATAGRPGGVAHGADDDDLRSDIRPVGGDRPRQDGPGGRRRRDDRRRGRIDADVGRQPADWSAPRLAWQ